jgi:hypothetical protein
MPLTMRRYDGLADWYDSWNDPEAARPSAPVAPASTPVNRSITPPSPPPGARRPGPPWPHGGASAVPDRPARRS